MASHSARTTTDHEQIKKWVEDRGGQPVMVKATERDGTGLLRIDFPDNDPADAEAFDPISWEKFFTIFDDRDLAFLFQEEKADGQVSYFFKFVHREGASAHKPR